MSKESDLWCRYRTPFDKDKHPVCKVGIDYRKFPQNFKLIPCIGANPDSKVLCPSYSPLTKQELQEKEDRIQARFKRIGEIREAIVETVKKSGNPPKGREVVTGRIPCPCCKTGTVGYSQASNGHIHAACSTKDCAYWME